jgi:class 3 adenylate cyclase
MTKYMGGGVLVYFGYPLAHEDDAERTVRAGAGVDRSGYRAPDPRSTANARRHCDWLSGGWSFDRSGSDAGAPVVGEPPNLAAVNVLAVC